MKTISFSILFTAVLFFAGARAAFAEPVYVPNPDFAQPQVTDFDTDVNTNMTAWEAFPPAQYNGGAIGVFGNLPQDGEYITNCIGSQAAYIFNETGLAFYQDYEAIDSTGAQATNFTARYDVGRTYQLLAGVIASTNSLDLPPGATLRMSAYYRDTNGSIVTVAATNIIYDTNVFTTDTGFVTCELDVPAVQPGDAWAGQHIGIEFLASTADQNLEGGFWDVGNVQLFSSVYVPNPDFAQPPVTDFDTDVNTNMTAWEAFPPAQYNGGAIGVFGNLPQDGEYITNCIGPQAAYIFNETGLAFYQDYEAIDSTGAPATNFSARYEIGKAYELSSGVIASTNSLDLPPGATLEMTLYYRDTNGNMVTVAATNIIYDTNVFTTDTGFVTCALQTATVKPGDPWAGQHIGIEFLASTADPQLEGGFWDVGNIQLSESLTPAIVHPAMANGQFQAMLLSDPGLAFQILASGNLSTPITGWTNIGTLTNVTGATPFVDTPTNVAKRFYEARQLPLP